MLVFLGQAVLAIIAIFCAMVTALLFTVSFNDDIKTVKARIYAFGFAAFSWVLWVVIFQM